MCTHSTLAVEQLTTTILLQCSTSLYVLGSMYLILLHPLTFLYQTHGRHFIYFTSGCPSEAVFFFSKVHTFSKIHIILHHHFLPLVAFGNLVHDLTTSAKAPPRVFCPKCLASTMQRTAPADADASL